jgi:tetratricopeptide (TPR) repeat protein
MHYSNIEEINISSNQYKTSNEHILQHTLYTEIPYAEILWDTSNTNPFDQMVDRQNMPPVYLELPTIPDSLKLFLPPDPAPRQEYWHTFTIDNILPPDDVSVDLNAIQEMPKKQPFEEYTNNLTKQIRPYDEIILYDGRSQQGKIIRRTNTRIFFQQKGREHTLEYPMENILKIIEKVSIEQICQEKIKHANYEEKIQLAQNANNLGLAKMGEKLFQQLILDYRLKIEPYIAYAQFCQDNCDYAKAIAILEKGIQTIKQNNEIKLNLAKIYLQFNLHEQALQLLQDCNNFDCIECIVKFYLQQQNKEKIQEYLDKAKQIAQYEHRPRLYSLEAQFALQNGNPVSCLELCTQAPQDDVALYQGISHYLLGNLSESISYFKKVIQQGDIRGIYNLALVYAQGDYPEAAITLLQKNQTHPSLIADPSTYKALLGYLLFRKKSKNALDMIKSAQGNNPQNPLVYYYLAELYYQTKDNLEEANQNYQKILRSNFSLAQILWRLAFLSFQENNFNESIKYIDECCLHPWKPEQKCTLHTLKAIIYFNQKNIKEARFQLQQALQHNQYNREALQVTLWFENQANQQEQALQTAEIILSQYENDPYTQKAKSKIEINQKLILWQDNFQRPDNPYVRAGWQEIEQNGLEIYLEKHQITFTGQMNLQRKPGALLRLIDYPKLHSFQGECNYTEANKTTAGLFIGVWEKKCLYFGKNDQKQLVYALCDEKKPLQWTTIDHTLLPNIHSHILKIEKIQDQKDRFNLFCDDIPVMPITLPNFEKEKVQAGFFATSLDDQWKFFVDNVELREIK